MSESRQGNSYSIKTSKSRPKQTFFLMLQMELKLTGTHKTNRPTQPEKSEVKRTNTDRVTRPKGCEILAHGEPRCDKTDETNIHTKDDDTTHQFLEGTSLERFTPERPTIKPEKGTRKFPKNEQEWHEKRPKEPEKGGQTTPIVKEGQIQKNPPKKDRHYGNSSSRAQEKQNARKIESQEERSLREKLLAINLSADMMIEALETLRELYSNAAKHWTTDTRKYEQRHHQYFTIEIDRLRKVLRESSARQCGKDQLERMTDEIERAIELHELLHSVIDKNEQIEKEARRCSIRKNVTTPKKKENPAAAVSANPEATSSDRQHTSDSATASVTRGQEEKPISLAGSAREQTQRSPEKRRSVTERPRSSEKDPSESRTFYSWGAARPHGWGSAIASASQGWGSSRIGNAAATDGTTPPKKEPRPWGSIQRSAIAEAQTASKPEAERPTSGQQPLRGWGKSRTSEPEKQVAAINAGPRGWSWGKVKPSFGTTKAEISGERKRDSLDQQQSTSEASEGAPEGDTSSTNRNRAPDYEISIATRLTQAGNPLPNAQEENETEKTTKEGIPLVKSESTGDGKEMKQSGKPNADKGPEGSDEERKPPDKEKRTTASPGKRPIRADEQRRSRKKRRRTLTVTRRNVRKRKKEKRREAGDDRNEPGRPKTGDREEEYTEDRGSSEEIGRHGRGRSREMRWGRKWKRKVRWEKNEEDPPSEAEKILALRKRRSKSVSLRKLIYITNHPVSLMCQKADKATDTQ